ncbi:MAG: hypothetical protein HQ595_01775 [Candidatus Omnitrophica bacterium]|nr:hypothetical protein [Candidatus Omnitrophota bacterium]
MKKAYFLLVLLLLSVSFSFAQSEEDFIYDDKGGRDPFFSLVDKHGKYLSVSNLGYSFDKLNLSGILWDAQGDSSALINNEIFSAGDSVDGFRIKEITQNSVIVDKDGREHTINVSIEQEEE